MNDADKLAQARAGRRRVIHRIEESMLAELLPKMRERPMTEMTKDQILFRLSLDAQRVARLNR